MADKIGATHRPIYGEGSTAPHMDKSAAAWAKQQAYKIRFTHPSSGHSVEFPANITSFSDSHGAKNEEKFIFGDNNPIIKTQWTARKISFTLSLTNASIEEARYNAQNINLLLCMMYPTLSREGDQTEGKPHWRVRGLNFLKDSLDSTGIGLYVATLEYSPNIDAGFITSNPTGILGEAEIYPVQIDINISGDGMIDTEISPTDETWRYQGPEYR